MPRRSRKKKSQHNAGKAKNQKNQFQTIIKENEKFLDYYKNLKLIPEAEVGDFIASLQMPLPSTFRITGIRSYAKQLLRCIRKHYFNKMDDVTIDGKVIPPPQPLPWYPDDLAWQINLTKNTIRSSSEMMRLKKLLIDETAQGNFSRQEAVSMIPPLLLDVQPHHYVLDMCAAPGSKTAQLIEFLHQDPNVIVPNGMLIANDADNKRCYMLVHQSKRLNSPCFMVTNYDASMMPNIFLKTNESSQTVAIMYDRILCDVPCSGDGTMRKNIMLWKHWNQNNALSLHCLQLRILIRGAELLARDGILVYSTCSFNPIENEAVISAIIKKANGAIRLVDVSDKLPSLQKRNGISNWKVLSKQRNWYEKFLDVPVSDSAMIKPTMFPPSEEEAAAMHLDRCIRIFPHDQNTGGFFVAVLQKIDRLTWSSKYKSDEATTRLDSKLESSPSCSQDIVQNPGASVKEAVEENLSAMRMAKETNDDPGTSSQFPPPKRAKNVGKDAHKEDPFVFMCKDDPIWPEIRNFYKLDNSFPLEQVFTRTNTGKKRSLYLASATIRNILQNNDMLRVINTGVKIFSRSESANVNCSFRVNQEGIQYVNPYVHDRKISMTKDDMIMFLNEHNPLSIRFSPSVLAQLLNLGQGCCLCTYENENECSNADNCTGFTICGWKGKHSIRPLITKSDFSHYLLLCDVDNTEQHQNENLNEVISDDEVVTGKEEIKDSPQAINND